MRTLPDTPDSVLATSPETLLRAGIMKARAALTAGYPGRAHYELVRAQMRADRSAAGLTQ